MRCYGVAEGRALAILPVESWFIADKLVPQDPSNPEEDPWENVVAYARIAGLEWQEKQVPGGQVFLPWNSQSQLRATAS